MEVILNELELTERDFRTISDLVYKYCGINLHDGKKELVRARLAKRLRKLRIGSFPEYIEYALSDPSKKEFTALIDALSTNLTSFFEDEETKNRERAYFSISSTKTVLKQRMPSRNRRIPLPPHLSENMQRKGPYYISTLM